MRYAVSTNPWIIFNFQLLQLLVGSVRLPVSFLILESSKHIFWVAKWKVFIKVPRKIHSKKYFTSRSRSNGENLFKLQPKNNFSRRSWRIASFDWILNDTSSHIILFATRLLRVILEIQSKQAIRQNLREISFCSENFSVRNEWFSSSMHFFSFKHADFLCSKFF